MKLTKKGKKSNLYLTCIQLNNELYAFVSVLKKLDPIKNNTMTMELAKLFLSNPRNFNEKEFQSLKEMIDNNKICSMYLKSKSTIINILANHILSHMKIHNFYLTKPIFRMDFVKI